MEHSVLCGSDKYPLKDPFVELLKGSLNTFLNAMTWPDKTMYPVASRNDQDFKNLMSIYMDAVLHPNIYKTDKILKQEGWHYELDRPDGEIIYNGVVYNEMRGAFSDPDTVLEHAMTRALYPGTTYEVVSGGDPMFIPDLTYDQFIAFHQRYYHPANSFILLYGDMDFTERLNWLDEAYLSKYDAIDPKTDIPKTQSFTAVKRVECSYNVAAGEEEGHSVFQYARAMDNLFDPVGYLAFQVLGYALLNAPGAPIKKALLDAGIGDDIYGGYDSGYREPDFTVTAKGTDPKDFDRFLSIIDEVLKKVVKDGIPKKTLYAGIHNIEFSLREADFGRMPRGLVYCFGMMDTWLHDETKALIHLQYDESFKKLKALVETDYFEKLVEKELLENPHGTAILMKAKSGIAEENDGKIKEKLAAYKASLSKEEIEALIEDTKALKAYQEAPDSEEAIRSIPLLKLEDVEEAPKEFKTEEMTLAGEKLLFHEIPTNGIGYAGFRFSLSKVPLEDFEYAGFLKNLYTLLSTKSHTYGELSDEISLKTGGIGFAAMTLAPEDGAMPLVERMNVTARFLEADTADAIALLREILTETVFSDRNRVREVLGELRSGLQESLVARGDSTASRRVLSYSTAKAAEDEALGGLDYFRFLDRLEKQYEENADRTIEKLQEVAAKIFTKDNVLVSFTGSRSGLDAFKPAAEALLNALPSRELPDADRTFAFEKKNEGLKTSSMVQYTAIGGNFKKYGYGYTGAYLVLRTILGFDYLWMNLRVKGGAYGCGSQFLKNGDVVFTSFRDPNLKETLGIYRAIPAYIRGLEIGPRDMTKYILGTFGAMDMPMQPSMEGETATTLYEQGTTDEMRLATRREVLHCTLEDLHALADPIEKVLSEDAYCTVGGETKVAENEALFTTVSTLQGERA